MSEQEKNHKEVMKMLLSIKNGQSATNLRLEGIDSTLTITNKRLSKIEERLSNLEKWIPTENTHVIKKRD